MHSNKGCCASRLTLRVFSFLTFSKAASVRVTSVSFLPHLMRSVRTKILQK